MATAKKPKKAYLVIWAGYVHRAVFTRKKDANAFIRAEKSAEGAWGVWTIEEVMFNPPCADVSLTERLAK